MVCFEKRGHVDLKPSPTTIKQSPAPTNSGLDIMKRMFERLGINRSDDETVATDAGLMSSGVAGTGFDFINQ